MTSLDEGRVRVVPGDGVVLRMPGIAAMALPRSDEDETLVGSVLEAARTAAGQPDAGRQATRAVAGLLASADDAPPLGLVGTDGDGLAVLLHGDVELTADGEVLSGRDAATWLDRDLPSVPTEWSLARAGAGAADDWSDLTAGVTRGDGLTTGSVAPVASPDQAGDVPAPPPPVDAPPPAPAADFVTVSLQDPVDDEPAREPLPLAATQPVATPPAGVLVLDDGTTFVVGADVVIGREPQSDPAVARGTALGVTLADSERAVSRVHARVTVEGDVVLLADAGSANGTFVAGATDDQWTPVTEPVPLSPGTHVLVGSRILSFDRHHAG